MSNCREGVVLNPTRDLQMQANDKGSRMQRERLAIRQAMGAQSANTLMARAGHHCRLWRQSAMRAVPPRRQSESPKQTDARQCS